MKTLEILSKKLKCVDADPTVKTSKALKDVQPELEKLRQKAVSKVCIFGVLQLYAEFTRYIMGSVQGQSLWK